MLDRIERATEKVRGLAYKLKTFQSVGESSSTYYGIEVGAATHTKINAMVYDDLLDQFTVAKRALRALLAEEE